MAVPVVVCLFPFPPSSLLSCVCMFLSDFASPVRRFACLSLSYISRKQLRNKNESLRVEMDRRLHALNQEKGDLAEK